MFRRLIDRSAHCASHIVRCVRDAHTRRAGVVVALCAVAMTVTSSFVYASSTDDRTTSETQRFIHLARERRQALEPMIAELAKLPTTDARAATLRMRITSTYTLIAGSEDSLVSVLRDGRAALASAGCAIRPFTETCAAIATSSDAVSAYIAWVDGEIAARLPSSKTSDDIVASSRQLAADWKKLNQTRATLVDEFTTYRDGECANDYYLWDCVKKQTTTGASLAMRAAARDASMIDTRMRIFAHIPRASAALTSLERDAASCTTGVCEAKLAAISLRQELASLATAALTLEAVPSQSARDITRLRIPTTTDVIVRFDRAYDHLTRSNAAYDACLVAQKNDTKKCMLQTRTRDASRETFAATVTPLQAMLTQLDDALSRVNTVIADVHLSSRASCRTSTTDAIVRLAGAQAACDALTTLPMTSLADTKYRLLARIGEMRTKLASTALVYRADEVATVKKVWDVELAAAYGEDAIRDDTYRAKEAAFRAAEAAFDQKERAFAQCLKYQTTDGQCNDAAAAWDTAMRAYAKAYGDYEGYHNERVAAVDAELAKLDAAIVDGLPPAARKAAIKPKALGSSLIDASFLRAQSTAWTNWPSQSVVTQAGGVAQQMTMYCSGGVANNACRSGQRVEVYDNGSIVEYSPDGSRARAQTPNGFFVSDGNRFQPATSQAYEAFDMRSTGGTGISGLVSGGLSGLFGSIGNAFGPTGVTGGANSTVDSVTKVGLDAGIGAGVGAGIGMLMGKSAGTGAMIGALAGGGLSAVNQMFDGKESIASSLVGDLFGSSSSSSSSSSSRTSSSYGYGSSGYYDNGYYGGSSGGGRGSSGGILGDMADMLRVSIDGQRGTNASFGGAFGLLGGLVNAKLSVSAGNRKVVAGCSGAGSELHGDVFKDLKVNSNLGLSLPIGAINIPLGGNGNTSIPTGTCTAPAVLDGPGAQAGLTTFKASYKGNTYGDLIGMITGWTNFVLPFVSVIAIAALIYAGFLYLTAGVNEENTSKAKTIVLYVVLGIVLIFSAYAIVNTVLSGQAN